MYRARKAALFIAAWSAVSAAAPETVYASGRAPAASEEKRAGHPTVVLDRLTLPALPESAVFERHLRQVLRREARRADWGAGRGHRIEYRFAVDRLEMIREGSVLKVHCAAIGRLPKGKTARSRLSYGGNPAKAREVVFRVLEIVARGVITRLSELERARRSAAR